MVTERNKEEYNSKRLEALIDSFKEGYGTSKYAVKKVIMDNWNTAKNYHEMRDALYTVDTINPNWDSMMEDERDSYFDYSKYLCEFRYNVYELFVEQHGRVHTAEEIKHIAVDFWIPRIFGIHFQDNGDNSPGGGERMLLMSAIQKSAQDRNDSPEIIEKAKQLIYEYFDPTNYDKCELSVDYDPCIDLYNILKDAGVNEGDIRMICPFKTVFQIDQLDYSVHIMDGYQNHKYL